MVTIFRFMMSPFVVIGVPIPVIVGGHHLDIYLWRANVEEEASKRLLVFLLLPVVVGLFVVAVA